MSNEIHWGGINGKSLCKAVISDIWMVFAVMLITYFGLGAVESMRSAPLYTSNTVIAVYPFNQMYTLENSSTALESVSAVNEVFNSEMFKTGLGERLSESEEYSLYSEQIDGTSILMLSVSSSSPENAYQILRSVLDYYGEISPHLVGESHLEILTEPNFPTSPSNNSKILKYRSLLTLFMGFAMVCFLVLMYATRKTYKTSSAIRRYYQNVRFFKISASKGERRNKKKSGDLSNCEAMRKTALELLQMLRAKNGNSIFVTSAAQDEGKTEIIVSLASKMVDLGKSVIIVESDFENSTISEHLAEMEKQSIKVVSADRNNAHDDYQHMVENIGKMIDQMEELADVILVEGCIWTGSREERIWKEVTDTSLAICRQDKADFYSIGRMMTDLQENDSEFLGCVLNEF